MNDYIIRYGDTSILHDFPDEALAPPKDHLTASAAARRGERKIDLLAALVRNSLTWERAVAAGRPTADNPNPVRQDWRRAPVPPLKNKVEQARRGVRAA